MSRLSTKYLGDNQIKNKSLKRKSVKIPLKYTRQCWSYSNRIQQQQIHAFLIFPVRNNFKTTKTIYAMICKRQ